MTQDTELIKRRFIELARKSDNAGIFTFTDFLGLAEQSAFTEIKKRASRYSLRSIRRCCRRGACDYPLRL